MVAGRPAVGKTNKSENLAGEPPRPTDALLAAARGRRGPAPVHLWNPPHCGDIDMRIARDGTWWHEGTPIGRVGLVRLFASILRRDPERDGGGFVLVTPHEKVGIVVEDAPFVAVDVERDGDSLRFETSLGDVVTADAGHPIRVERAADGEPRPYVLVRGGLEALIDRKTFYRLVEMGEEAEQGGEAWFGVRSGGAFFPIGPAAELSDP